ncbi:MAG: PepSY domain-containing protein [Verrucomicrobia bacterium]|nr:PepSY domain-containing protein [Verrucomicrobiota bacterium]
MKPVSRPLHRSLSPWLAAPLILVALTGLTYRIGRSWFGMPKEVGNQVLDFHTGMWLGKGASLVYTSMVGFGLLALTISGAVLLWKSRAKTGSRRWHRIVAWVLVLPLFASASTGLLHHYGELVFGFEKDTQSLLMNIHQGNWLGPKGRPFYILWVGLGLLTLVVTGVSMLRRKTSVTAPKTLAS